MAAGRNCPQLHKPVLEKHERAVLVAYVVDHLVLPVCQNGLTKLSTKDRNQCCRIRGMTTDRIFEFRGHYRPTGRSQLGTIDLGCSHRRLLAHSTSCECYQSNKVPIRRSIRKWALLAQEL